MDAVPGGVLNKDSLGRQRLELQCLTLSCHNFYRHFTPFLHLKPEGKLPASVNEGKKMLDAFFRPLAVPQRLESAKAFIYFVHNFCQILQPF